MGSSPEGPVDQVVDLLTSFSPDDEDLSDLRGRLVALSDRDVPALFVLSFVMVKLIDEMLDWKADYIEDVEKTYGIPWREQLDIIQGEVLERWRARLEWYQQDGQSLTSITAEIIRIGRSYERIAPEDA